MKGLPKRKRDANKGDFGKVLVVAGSPGMCGAAVLAGLGAYRAGAGLVYHACPRSVADILSAKQDCAVVWPFDETDAVDTLLEYASRCDAAVIGPGISQAQAVLSAVRELVLAVEIPFVLDADGLNAFASQPDLLARGKGRRVLTPHPGEAARLLGRSIGEIQADRKRTVQDLADRFLAVAVLKGYRTLVCEGKKTYMNRTGNPGMATGGTGDVLSGVIGALIGQGLSPYDAACLGVRVHGKAGDLAAKELGETSLMASDLPHYISRAFRSKR